LKFTGTYVISKEDAVITVLGIYPGVADKVQPTLFRKTFDSEVLKEELTRVIVLDNDSTWDAYAVVPLEKYFQFCLSSGEF
jgi:hypothetical protein